MVVKDDTTQLREEIVTLPVVDGIIAWENSKYLLATVFERYGKNNSIGYGFVTGSGLKKGAFASTWVHDHHNLLVVGSQINTMVKIANLVVEQQGGIAIGDNGKVLANLPLEIGGIMSDRPIKEVSKGLEDIRNALIELGYKHYNPIMSIGTYGLAVSPYLKLTNKGLVDVPKGKLVDLIVG